MSGRRARDRLIVALDVDTLASARGLVRELAGEVGCFKVGKQLFVQEGPAVVRMIRSHGAEVFLDLKFHDIPNTVAHAAVAAARLDVRFVTLHASGGLAMMRAAVDEVARACRRERLRRPTLLAVTVLTSLDAADLRRVGVDAPVERQVVRLARLARDAGIGGVVASPLEVARIRRACGSQMTIVTPGVRMPGAERDDQQRVMTPASAMRAGADYLVVGRPILGAPDRVAAARAIVGDMATGLRRPQRTTSLPRAS